MERDKKKWDARGSREGRDAQKRRIEGTEKGGIPRASREGGTVKRKKKG